MNSVVVRAISGLIYVAAIIYAIFAGKWYFCGLTVLFAVIAIHEYFNMAHEPYGDKERYTKVQIVDMIFCALLPLSTCVSTYSIGLTPVILVLLAYFLVRAIIGLTDKGEHAFREVAKSVFGVVYIGLPMWALNLLYHMPYGKFIVLGMFIMIWLNDTGAFCFGITLGKHRLCERLSPKKSWEGFWGGMGCCVAFGIIIALCFHTGYWQLALIGILVSLMSTWGDLFESMLKRTVKVKDSGSLIPGHGGILDRIDSLLFVAPTIYIFLFILNHLYR